MKCYRFPDQTLGFPLIHYVPHQLVVDDYQGLFFVSEFELGRQGGHVEKLASASRSGSRSGHSAGGTVARETSPFTLAYGIAARAAQRATAPFCAPLIRPAFFAAFISRATLLTNAP